MSVSILNGRLIDPAHGIDDLLVCQISHSLLLPHQSRELRTGPNSLPM